MGRPIHGSVSFGSDSFGSALFRSGLHFTDTLMVNVNHATPLTINGSTLTY